MNFYHPLGLTEKNKKLAIGENVKLTSKVAPRTWLKLCGEITLAAHTCVFLGQFFKARSLLLQSQKHIAEFSFH